MGSAIGSALGPHRDFNRFLEEVKAEMTAASVQDDGEAEEALTDRAG